jgi:hypothetical protein
LLLFFAVLFLLTGRPVVAIKCPHCLTFNPDQMEYCRRCLRSLTWQMQPRPAYPYVVVVRSGEDSFIRGPNDIHPRDRFSGNNGGDATGPIGSFYSPTGFRYLIRFDIPEAFARAGIPLAEFEPQECLLVLRYCAQPVSREDIPIVAFPLSRPFLAGTGRRAEHPRRPDGATWELSTPDLPWGFPGSDFHHIPSAAAVIPASGSGEISLDITDILSQRWRDFRTTGTWNDPGLILMRDPTRPGRGLYRVIHSFQAAPAEGLIGRTTRVLSPELFIR